MFGRRLQGEAVGALVAVSAALLMAAFMLWRMGLRAEAAETAGMDLLVWAGVLLAARPGPARGFFELHGKIVSPDGWWVEPAGPDALIYGEPGLMARVPMRLGTGRELLRIRPSGMTAEGSGEPLDEAQKRQIAARISLAYRSLGHSIGAETPISGR